MRTFRLRVVANNIDWPTLPQLLEDVRAFFAPSLALDITIEHVDLMPVYDSSVPGVSPLSVVDYDWYDWNISVPHLADADIVLFLTPRPATPATVGGIMTFANCGPWETTVFALNEHDHGYVNMKDLGNVNALLIKHELTHVFYRMKSMADANDHTHQYFYGGTPESVLPELAFGELGASERLAELGRKLVGGLVALGIIGKKRIAIREPETDIHVGEPQPPAPVPLIEKWADGITKAEGAKPSLNNPGNLKYAPLTASWGATKGFAAQDGGYIAAFPTPAMGRKALCNFLELGCRDQLAAFHQARTLGAFMRVYANNPPQGYLNTISFVLGVPLSTNIATFLG